MKSVPAGQAPRGVYFQVDHYENACWYTKNHYSDPNLVEGSASVAVTTDFGEWVGVESLDHLVFRIKRAAKSNHYAAISFSLKLHVYSQDHRLIATRDVSENTIDRYQVNGVDLSPEGNRVFCARKDTLLCFDHNLNQINSWKIPAKQIRAEVTSPEYARSLSLLGLVGTPSNDDIKAAYRKQLLTVHPDVNSQDPLANEKTRSVIAAYERLTSAKYRDENSRYHDELQAGFVTFRLPAFGDQITATQSTDSTVGVYIGCYSGESYLVKNDGAFTHLYTCKAPIRVIREAGRYVYLVSESSCDVLAEGKFVARFAHAPGFGRLVWGAILSWRSQPNAYGCSHSKAHNMRASTSGITYQMLTCKTINSRW